MKKALINAIKNILNLTVYGSLVMINGELFPLPLVKGNSKLGKRVWHSSTLPTCGFFEIKLPGGGTVTARGTCPTTCRGCYATSGRYNDPNNKYLLHMRTRLLREYPDIYFALVRLQLTYENIDRLRIHAAGDFIPGEAAGFMAVLRDFPGVSAWTYTKCNITGEIADLDALPNCNIVKSIIPGCGFNYGPIEYIAALFFRLIMAGESVYICRCGIDHNQHCSDCDGCAKHKYVLFVEHSTGYDPRRSPFWDKFMALVNNQKNYKRG